MRYKRAALKDHLGKITGTSAGALAGGLGGYGIVSLFSDNKSIRILAALAGAVGGGYGGYRLGNYMDTLRAGLILSNDLFARDLAHQYGLKFKAQDKAKQLKNDKELFRMFSDHLKLQNTGLKQDRGLFKKWYEDNLKLLKDARNIVNDIINNGGQVDPRLVLLLNNHANPTYGGHW